MFKRANWPVLLFFAALLASLLLILAEPLSLTQTAHADTARTANFMIRYDVDSGTETFCRVTGQNGDPYGGSIGAIPQLKTTGSSTSVTENVASTNPFADLAVGDILLVTRGTGTGVTDVRVITVRTDAANVTIDTAVDWSGGFTFRYLKTRCGTTDSDGWIEVGGAERIAMTLQYDQGDLDNLSVRWYCRAAGIGSLPVQVYPNENDNCGAGGTLASSFCDFPTPGLLSRITVVAFEPWNVCRMGFKRKTTDTSDAGAALEQVTASITTSR